MTSTTQACPKCGKGMEPGARFCPSCGAVAPAQVTRPSAPTTPLPAMTKVVTPNRGARLLEQLREATLGEYEVLAELGSGGMASVFLAHDLQLDRRVAIKVMHPALLAGEGMVERFILEARTAAGLSHPNIIPIYAVRVEEELLFFVMKFVEGRPLDSIIKKEAPLHADMVRQIIGAVADALAYAHGRGVIHRDIKPANIMISTEGHPILTDFGIAKVADKQGLTMTGATIGTPTYMSPEQCNALPLTGASDQYSLGVMAYEMMSGRPPFESDSVMTIMYKHIHEPPPPVEEKLPGCPPDLGRTISRMLAKEPGDRFPDLADVVRAIQKPTESSETQVRTQLVQFAMQGENRQVLRRVSTPRSPIPTMARKKTRTPPTPQVAGAAEPRRSRVPLLVGGLLVAVTAVALGVLRPWAGASSAEEGPTPNSAVAPDTSLGLNIPADSPAAQVAAPDPGPSATPPVATADTPATPRRQTPARPTTSTSAAPQVASIRISGNSNLAFGSGGNLQAVVIGDNGQVLTGRPVQWNSSDPDVVSVSSSGQLIAREAGTATITASLDNVSQSFRVSVAAEPVAEVSVTPASLALKPGESQSLTARPRAASGRTLSAEVQWSSNAPQVASVSTDGRVTAQGPGSATITASTGNVRTAVPVTVEQAGPTDADLRAQVNSAIQAYAAALQSRDVSRVRQLYPGMSSQRESQLRSALPSMENLQVRLTVGQIDLSGNSATAVVTGNWTFSSGGRSNRLPADNVYLLDRRGNGYVITEIR